MKMHLWQTCKSSSQGYRPASARKTSGICTAFPSRPPLRNVRAKVSPDAPTGAVDDASARAQDAASSSAVKTFQSRRHALVTFGGSALLAVAATATGELAASRPALAALKDYNLDPNAPIDEVEVQLGTEDGQYAFFPNTLEFTMGRICKLKLRNPSSSTHYFTPLEFSEKIFTILVLAGDPAVEVKGAISEVALKAGASATWVFIPMKPGRYPVRCTVKGHDGMVGTLVVKRAE